MRIFVTGAAGFIGYHLSRRLLESGHDVVAMDKVDSNERLAILNQFEGFNFRPGCLATMQFLQDVGEVDYIVHLAALPNVRKSIGQPYEQIKQDVLGYVRLLEYTKELNDLKHMVFISSSSVYGIGGGFSEKSPARPIAPYSVSKLNNENMNTCYSYQYGFPITSLRLFTTYGPFGRKEMMVWICALNILQGKPVPLFNGGRNKRDFVFVSDVVDAVTLALFNKNSEGHNIYNVGTGTSVSTMEVIRIVENLLGRRAELEMLPSQQGDVATTCADIRKIKKDLGFSPKVNISNGLEMFVDWLRPYVLTCV